jgi:ankyrin repeat protein
MMNHSLRKTGETELYYLCRVGLTASVVRKLSMRSFDVEGITFSETCLMVACRHGHLDICRLLIEKGANVDARELTGMTSLHFAIKYIEIVRLLCDNGADINARGHFELTALSMAAYDGHLDVVQELVERDADINAKSTDGWTALTAARENGKADVDAYLVTHGGLLG